jgi:serine/threonine protein kinase
MASGDREMADQGPEDSASDSRRDPLVGSVVNGKYKVLSAIARGGMGRIYYATQVPLERPVALKVVQGDGDHEHESQFLKRFLQEASILAKLQHPNVVTLFDYGKVEGSHVEQYFIAMEFLAGETLTHRFKTRGRLTIAEALVLARQIGRGLREAHKRGIVHRDLKPSNIILVPEGDGTEIVKLVDFGIGKVLGRPGDAQDLTQDGVFVGTPRYMAPEQFEGNASPASDYYALGTILFQALAGRLPFVGTTMSEFMVAKLARAVPTIREVAPDAQVPDSLEALIQHLLARNPDDRPSLEQLQSHLMACEEEVFGTPHSMRRGNSSGPHSFAGGVTGSGPYSMAGTGSNTGSGPVLPNVSSSVPHLMGAPPNAYHADQMRVPPTMVQAIPNYAQMAQMTPRPMAAPTYPPEPAKPTRAPLVLALLFVAIAGVGAGIYYKSTRPHGGDGATTSGSGASGATGDATGAGGAGGAAGATAAFTLTIDSAPAGATVMEGENVLGETPVKVAIDRASVSAFPRTFVITKDGFAPSHLVQGPSLDNVRSVVSLAPAAAAASSAGADASTSAGKIKTPGGKPVAQATGTPTAKPTATAPTTATGPGLDIRLKR